LRSIAQQLFHRTLAAIDVESVVLASVRLRDDQLEIFEEKCDLTKFKRVLVIAIGKASLGMARGIERVLGDRLTDGLIVTNALIGDHPQFLPVLIGGHPLPNAASFEAAERALKILQTNDAEDTLVLFLISGGGSAMFEMPVDPKLTLDDLQAVNHSLVGCGAVINEMNIVRRRLSAVKGGKLAAAAPLSRQISLYISDVNSDDLTTVASGPTLPDHSTIEDFHRVISHYRLMAKFPPGVAGVITSWKAGSPAFSRSLTLSTANRTHYLLLDNRRALNESKRIAQIDFGLEVEIAGDLVEGEIEEMVRIHLDRLQILRARHAGKTVCLISGGEVICPVRGPGQGGRNQEFVLRTAIILENSGAKNVVVLSAGTDGIDGHSPAAGAIADEMTVRRASKIGISAASHLRESDSFNFFDGLGDAIMTGPTGNNVRDLRIMMAQ
jgi:hydroxypyruvate reductase